MKVGSLFSGIGGFDLGLERAGFEIAWQVEIDEYCRQVLKKHWPAVPCHYDIKQIDWRFIQPVDLVCGGFPCQPFSCAGKRRGAADDRYLWPEVVRCLQTIRPAWFLGENVPGLLHLGIEQVCADLEALGYQVAVLGIPACAVDAPHIRQRVWVLAHAEYCRRIREPFKNIPSLDTSQVCGRPGMSAETSGCCASMADAPKLRRGQGHTDARGNGKGTRETGKRTGPSDVCRWTPEPAMGELVNGVSGRLVRFGGRVVQSAAQRKEKLKALGNAIVPQIAEAIGRMIKEASCLTLTGLMS